MLESVWVFTTVERGNFTPNWLRTILFVYDFWHFPGRALNVHCTLRPPPSPKRKTEQQLASFQARLWGFTTILLMNFAPLHFIHWSVKLPTKIVVKLPKVPTTTINVFTSPFQHNFCRKNETLFVTFSRHLVFPTSPFSDISFFRPFFQIYKNLHTYI